MTKALITQSNYIPWKGYFDSINSCDVFVIYDDMQFTKRDWRNRNKIKTQQGLKWLSVPVEVKGKFHQKINETKIADTDWALRHWDSLKHAYSRAECFAENSSWVRSLMLDKQYETITELNVSMIKGICQFLGITTEVLDSRDFQLAPDRTERLVKICSALGADTYLTGPAARAYMDESAFSESGIRVEYADYSGYAEYEQLNPPFEHGVTILDLIFNLGEDASKYMKSF